MESGLPGVREEKGRGVERARGRSWWATQADKAPSAGREPRGDPPVPAAAAAETAGLAAAPGAAALRGPWPQTGWLSGAEADGGGALPGREASRVHHTHRPAGVPAGPGGWCPTET